MRGASFSLLSATLLLVGGAVAGSHGKSAECSAVDASIVANSGQPVGSEVKNGNGKSARNLFRLPFLVADSSPSVTLYITKPDKKNPRTKARANTAVLYLTDVFGIALPENKLYVPPHSTTPAQPPLLKPPPPAAWPIASPAPAT